MNKIVAILSLIILTHGQCSWARAEPNYLQRLINYNTSAPSHIFKNPLARCNFILNGRVFIDTVLVPDTKNQFQYDSEISTLKMIIDNKLALILFEKFNQQAHAVEGVFFDSHGYHGPVNGRCIY